jgi:hypothetical protein
VQVPDGPFRQNFTVARSQVLRTQRATAAGIEQDKSLPGFDTVSQPIL